jgi:sulfate adenylyltransferase
MLCLLIKKQAEPAADYDPAAPRLEDLEYDLDDDGPGVNEPHGAPGTEGNRTLADPMVSPEEARELLDKQYDHMHRLNLRQTHDLEMIMTGYYSPISTFLNRADYENVVANHRLADGTLWAMPITLDVSQSLGEELERDLGNTPELAIRDEFFNLLAVLKVTEVWKPDKEKEAQMVFDPDYEKMSGGVLDPEHPAIDYLLRQSGPYYVSGELLGVQRPLFYDYAHLRKTPKELRAEFKAKGYKKIVAFQTRNPMHRAHIELARRAGQQLKAMVHINPVVGPTKPGDVYYVDRVQCYQAMLGTGKYFKDDRVYLSLLPLAMRMAGPREALHHAIIRKNGGNTHFIIGRDHAGCKRSKKLGDGEDFYGPYDAQTLMTEHAKELGIEIAMFPMMVYRPDHQKYYPMNEIEDGVETKKISGTKFRGMLERGEKIPTWFSDPKVMDVLYNAYPPRNSRGIVLFFTGLSGSGKTTISQALYSRLQEIEIATSGRQISILDGDVIRTHLSKGLGFSRADRLENIRRIGFVGSEIAKHRGIAMAVAIAPFEEARAEARAIVEEKGGAFIEVYVNTTVETCAERDVKGLYAKASRGDIKLTGVNDPFEAPTNPEIAVMGSHASVTVAVDQILDYLHEEGYIAHPDTGRHEQQHFTCAAVPEHKEEGKMHQEGYKFYYTNKNEQVSAWHSLPLYADEKEGTFNFVNEIPKLTRAKMELNKEEPGNPIMQDTNKDGSLRFYTYGDSRFNYGFLPQTWEDPDECVHANKTWCGDNDPIDVIEVTSLHQFATFSNSSLKNVIFDSMLTYDHICF